MVERDEFGREIVYVSGKDIPSRPQWNKHINNCVEEGNMEKAMSAARDMMNLGVEPNVITFTTLIKGWCKVGKMSVAMHVTKVMLKKISDGLMLLNIGIYQVVIILQLIVIQKVRKTKEEIWLLDKIIYINTKRVSLLN